MSISTGLAESPLMTWGEIESTPFRLDGSDTPITERNHGPSFKVYDPGWLVSFNYGCFHLQRYYFFVACQRFQSQEEGRGLAWRWQMKPLPKIAPRSKRRYERLQRILQGKHVLSLHFWVHPRRFVAFYSVLLVYPKGNLPRTWV